MDGTDGLLLLGGFGQSLFCFFSFFSIIVCFTCDTTRSAMGKGELGKRHSEFCLALSFCCYSLGFAVPGRSGLGLVFWLSGVGLAWDFLGSGYRITHYTLAALRLTPMSRSRGMGNWDPFLEGAAAAAGCCWLQLDRNEKQTAFTYPRIELSP